MIVVQAIPYANFKEKMKIIKQYEKTCYTKDLGNAIYVFKDTKRGIKGMEVRCKKCRKLLAKIERAEDCALEIKCPKCKLKAEYDLNNI